MKLISETWIVKPLYMVSGSIYVCDSLVVQLYPFSLQCSSFLIPHWLESLARGDTFIDDDHILESWPICRVSSLTFPGIEDDIENHNFGNFGKWKKVYAVPIHHIISHQIGTQKFADCL